MPVKRCKVCKFRVVKDGDGDTCWVCNKYDPQGKCGRCGQEMPVSEISSYDGMCQPCQDESYK